MSASIRKWIPPNLHELLVDAMQEDAEWYEVRTKLSCISYEVGEYDKALKDTKLLKMVFPNVGMYYCWIETKEINDCQVG